MPYNGMGGLFGSPMAGMMAQRQMQQPMAEEPKRWLDGGKFKTRDALGLALGAIGDAFTGRPTTSQMILGNFQQRRMAEEQQKLFEQQRQAGLQDYATKLGIKAQFEVPEPPKPGSFEWWQTATPEQRAEYDRFNPIVRMTPWSGTEFIGRTGGPQSMAGPQAGAVEDGYRFKGGDPANPDNWEAI